MMQSWIAYSQHGTGDSTMLYSAPIWKVRRLVHDAGLKAHCDSLNRHLEAELSITKLTLTNQIDLTNEVTLSRDTWKYTSEQKDSIITNRDLIHKSETKQLKKQKFKLTLLAIGQGVVIVLLIL